MSEVNEREALAKAMYFELREGSYTYQVIVAPDAVSADKSKIYQASVVHRRVSHWAPRKNWKFSGWGYSRKVNFERTPMGDFEKMEKEDLDSLVSERMRELIVDSLNILGRRNYTLTKSPFVVEMAEKDYALFSQQKMSPDLYRRIVRSRQDFDYPEDIFLTPQPAVA
jgi:hypothetical protein